MSLENQPVELSDLDRNGLSLAEAEKMFPDERLWDEE
jgi:hypothetical protein